MRGSLLRHHPATRLPLLLAHAALCLAAAPRDPHSLAIRSPDRACPAAATAAARKPTVAAASAAADRACRPEEMAPTERQPGEWESPITSQLITSAVGEAQPV